MLKVVSLASPDEIREGRFFFLGKEILTTYSLSVPGQHSCVNEGQERKASEERLFFSFFLSFAHLLRLEKLFALSVLQQPAWVSREIYTYVGWVPFVRYTHDNVDWPHAPCHMQCELCMHACTRALRVCQAPSSGRNASS